MYDFINLSLKCPVCGKSLMDKDHLVDNNPSIKLNIEVDNKKGTIRLSSVYGSYNYTCNIKILENTIAKFSCPHCFSEIKSEVKCTSCQAPMVPFHLDMGGKVSICSRSGCKNHFVEFDDLELALKKLYQEHGFRGRKYPERPDIFKDKPKKKETDEDQEILKSGTFLSAYCPYCKKSLIENDKLKLKIINGKTGYLYLSPYLNVFTSKSTIFLSEDETVKEVRCFHCDTNLIEKEKKCDSCGSPIAKVSISARTKMIDFYMCTKKGCKWHGLNSDDLDDIRLEDSLEW
ncbi:MAG: hypothetical protein KAT68_10810 [Bacteroidales bacterium]|nr:hypothetical protein [Bacteroidales bacterium]